MGLPRGKAPRLTTLQGEWGQEYHVSRAHVRRGEQILESRTGTSGHAAVPFFAASPPSFPMSYLKTAQAEADAATSKWTAISAASTAATTRTHIEEGFSYLHHPRMAGGGCQISKNYTSW